MRPAIENSRRPINCAIVGLGRHAKQSYLSFLTNNPCVRLAAVCDLPQRHAEFNRTLLGAPLFTDLETMLSDVNPDAAIISTPHDLHYSQAEKCLDAGAHVLVDKPLALTTGQVEALIKKSSQAKRVLYSALPRRHSLFANRIEEMVNSGMLGDIREIEITYHRPRYHGFEQSWRNRPRVGGGALADAGYHFVDMLFRLFPQSIDVIDCQMEKDGHEVDVLVDLTAMSRENVYARINLCLNGSCDGLTERVDVHGSKAKLYFVRTRKVDNDKQDKRELLYITVEGTTKIFLKERRKIDLMPLLDFIQRCQNANCSNEQLVDDLRVVDFIHRAYQNAGIQYF